MSILWLAAADGVAPGSFLRGNFIPTSWLKSQGKGYQTRITEILRTAMISEP